MYTSENPIDCSETKCSIWNLKLSTSIKQSHAKTQKTCTWYDFTVQKEYLFLNEIYSSDDLKRLENISSLEKFYDAFDHFPEGAVLLNKCCSRNTNIDDLGIDSFRYFFMKI